MSYNNKKKLSHLCEFLYKQMFVVYVFLEINNGSRYNL